MRFPRPLFLMLLLLALPAGALARPATRIAPGDSAAWRHATWRPPYREWIDSAQTATADSAARAVLAGAERARADAFTLAVRRMDAAETAIYAGLAREPRTLTLAEDALATLERAPGRDSLAYARGLFVLGEVMRRRRSLEAADSLFELGGAIRERHLPADDVDVAGALAMRATVKLMRARPGARPLLERAYAIRRRIFGPGHYRTLQLLNNIAMAKREEGDGEGVCESFEAAARGFEASLGATSNDAVRAWTNVGLAAKDLGDFPRAAAAFETALRGLAGQSHPDTVLYTQTTLSYAEMALDLGDVAEAQPLVEHGYAMTLRYFPPGDGDYASTQYQMARLMFQLGQNERGHRFLDSAMVREAEVRPDSTGLAPLFYNRARVLRAQRDPKAVESMRLAWRLWKQGSPRPGPYMTLVQADFGGTLCDAGRAAEALPLLREAVSWADSLYGPSHPQTLAALEELARAQIATHDTAAAATAILVATGRREHLRISSSGFSERQALLWASRAGLGLDPILELATAPNAAPRLRRQALDALAGSRGVVLDEMAERVRRSARSARPEVRALVDSLQTARERLARGLVRSVGGGGEERLALEREQGRDRREAERFERALAAAAPELADAPPAPTAENLAGALGPRDALVSYARWRDAGAGRAPAEHLAAFVLRPGEDPRVFDLGGATATDALVESWRETMRDGLARSAGRDAERAAQRAGEALRRRVWDPLATALAGAERVRIVPDGSLLLVDFAALPAREGGWLVEHGPLLARASHERDLLLEAGDTRPEALLAVGGVDFDRSDALAASLPGEFRGAPPACASFREVRFAPLPGAAAESRQVLALWQSTQRSAGRLLEGEAAGEHAFKTLAPSATRLHLATHGFVLSSACAAPDPGRRGIGGIAASSEAPGGAPALDLLGQPSTTFTRLGPASDQNPLRLSGLALAGANARGQAEGDGEDGVLTAEEIASLDLSGVRDVVLSACDTGLGDIAAGEGVLGLERSFRVAGAGNLVLSLWPVSDATTGAWMEHYWRSRLEQNAEPAAAARAADRAALAGLRARGESTHPARWAGFVATGAAR